MTQIGEKLRPRRCALCVCKARGRVLNLVQGQTFMVIGAAGELPKPPSTPTVFLEGASDISYPGTQLTPLQTWTTPSLHKLYALISPFPFSHA